MWFKGLLSDRLQHLGGLRRHGLFQKRVAVDLGLYYQALHDVVVLALLLAQESPRIARSAFVEFAKRPVRDDVDRVIESFRERGEALKQMTATDLPLPLRFIGRSDSTESVNVTEQEWKAVLERGALDAYAALGWSLNNRSLWAEMDDLPFGSAAARDRYVRDSGSIVRDQMDGRTVDQTVALVGYLLGAHRDTDPGVIATLLATGIVADDYELLP